MFYGDEDFLQQASFVADPTASLDTDSVTTLTPTAAKTPKGRTGALPPVHPVEASSVFGATEVFDANAVATAASVSKDLKEHQAKIPRLPVPTLQETMSLYLSSLEPLCTAEEYDKSKEAVDAFLAPNGVGARLQAALEEREASCAGPSWLEAWWDDGYLKHRDPIPINVNYYFALENHADARCHTQVGRAASLVHNFIDYYCRLRDGQIPLETERGQPSCMSQYARVFNATRLPGKDRDQLVTYTTRPRVPDEELSATTSYVALDAAHIVVLCRNRFFRVPVLPDGGRGQPLHSVEALVRLLHAIVECSKIGKPGAPTGLFTAMPRGKWFDAREHLVAASPKNVATLEAIQTALMVVCLDDVVPKSRMEVARLILHGPGTNRWFDRHNYIVAGDGTAGINFEHAVGDASTTLRIVDDVFRKDSVTCPTAEQVEALVSGPRPAVEAYELEWVLDETLSSRLSDAFVGFKQLVLSNETSVLHFTQFGGDYIKKAKFSPDAFVQIAFQLAYFRLYGRNDATYEAASTKSFLHGRTEVVRSVTTEVSDFCIAANTPLFARRPSSRIPTQLKLLNDAADAHRKYMLRAKAARGVDRHLLGLYKISAEMDLDVPLFSDPNFTKSQHWRLSTSHCGSPSLQQFGFGPVVYDGFGLGYMIKNNAIDVVVTSKYSHKLCSSTIMAQALESALLHMSSIVESNPDLRHQGPTALHFSHPTTLVDEQGKPMAVLEYDYNELGTSGPLAHTSKL